MRQKGITISMVVVMVINLLFFNINVSYADNKIISSNEIIDSVTISHENESTNDKYYIGEKILLKYKWSLNGQKKGDIIKLKLPKEFILANNMKFNIKNNDGIVIGEVDALKDGNVTITLTDPTDYIQAHTNIKGSLFFQVNFNKKIIESGKTYPIEFETKYGSEKIEVTIKPEKAPNTNEILVKWGKVNAEDGYISWTIRLNYAQKNIKDMILNEELGYGHEYKKGSISISEAEFDYNTGESTKEKDVTKNFKVNERKNGFNINFGNTDKGYYVRFISKITDDTLNKYENTVEVS